MEDDHQPPGPAGPADEQWLNSTTASAPIRRSIFVGRREELAQLLAALREVLAGRGRICLIGGEPGIGKSRLADEIAAHAQAHGAKVLWGRCWEAGGAPAYWPWLQSIRAYIRDSDVETLRAQLAGGGPLIAQLLPELRELLPEQPPPASADVESARFQLFDATTTFLKQVAGQQPLIFILDDLHAADAPSLLLLRFLARELAESAIMVLGTYRDSDAHQGSALAATLAELARVPFASRLNLRGLSRESIPAFIETITGRAPSERLVGAVFKQTEGNPLFLGEVVRLLAQEGRLEAVDERAFVRLSVPVSVRQVIGRRLAHLSEDCYRLLTFAAVLGREFRLDALEQVTGNDSDQLLALLDEAVRLQIIGEMPGLIGRFRFAHALIRDVLYDELTPLRRLQLHRRTGEVLEALYAPDRESHLAELAHHFFEAAPAGGVDKAIDLTQSAAARSTRLLAYEEAVRFYQMTLQLYELKRPADDTERCRLLLALGDVQMRAGDMPAARDTFLRAAGLARSRQMPEALAHAALGYGGRFVWLRAGTDPHLIPLLEEALTALRDADSPLRVRLLARLAGALRDQPSSAVRVALGRQAVVIAERLSDPAALAYALDGLYAALWSPASTEEGLAIATQLIAAAEAAGDRERLLQGYHYRCLVHLELGNLEAMYADLDAQIRLADKLRQPAQELYVASVQAMIAAFQGRWQEAERFIAGARDRGSRAQGPVSDVFRISQLFAICLQQGRLVEIEDALRQVMPEHASYYVFPCALARLYIELGRHAEAKPLYAQLAQNGFAAIPFDLIWIFCLCLLAEVAEALEDLPGAALLYDRLLPYAQRNALSPPDCYLGSVSRYLGILAALRARWEVAEAHYKDALAMDENMGARPWQAHTQYNYARMLLHRNSSGDPDAAQRLLEQAAGTCEELGMSVLGSKMAVLLQHTTAQPAGKHAEAPLPVEPTTGQPITHGIFRHEGDYWWIDYAGSGFRLKDSKGLHYLARLLRSPGREVHALDLVAGAAPPADRTCAPEQMPPAHLARLGLRVGDLGDAGAILDPQAKAAYRERISELQDEIAEAEAWHDSERASRARAELAFLAQELAAAFGLGGRERQAASAAEKARVNVTRAIKTTLTRIAQHNPQLGQHLSTTIHTGTFCSYSPDPRVPISWQF